VGVLKRAGNLDEIWFKMLPRKTINYWRVPEGKEVPPSPSAAPSKIEVVHYDFNTLGLRLLGDPNPQMLPPVPLGFNEIPNKPELKIMVLLNAGAGIKIEKPAAAY
jgi:hypothetical protein